MKEQEAQIKATAYIHSCPLEANTGIQSQSWEPPLGDSTGKSVWGWTHGKSHPWAFPGATSSFAWTTLATLDTSGSLCDYLWEKQKLFLYVREKWNLLYFISFLLQSKNKLSCQCKRPKHCPNLTSAARRKGDRKKGATYMPFCKECIQNEQASLRILYQIITLYTFDTNNFYVFNV